MEGDKDEHQRLDISTITEPENDFFYKPLNAGANLLKRIFLLNVQEYMNYLYRNVIQRDIKFQFQHTAQLSDDQMIKPENFVDVLNMSTDNMTKWTLFKSFFLKDKFKFFMIVFVLFLYTVSKCVISILLSTMIDNYKENLYGYGVLLVLLNGLSVVCQHQFYSIGYEYSAMVRMSMANTLYHKIFRLQIYQVKNANQGKIINMISSDLNILEPFLIYMFVVINLPVALILTGAILWVRFEGAQGLLLIAILFLGYPIQIFFTHRITKYIKITKENADQRVKLTNEFIEGIRLIKMYAWEEAFQHIIKAFAHKEHKAYFLTHLQYVLLRGSTFFSQMWATAVFFMIIHYADLYPLNLSIMLSTLQLAAFIRFFCITLSSFGLDFLANLRIVLDRFKSILIIKEIAFQTNQGPKDELKLINFQGYWNDSKPTIEINYNFKKGIYAIVGKIGSGKTSLLNAILGEMPLTTGEIQFGGTMAYVEQEPFIFPGSIKENVIFGRFFEQKRYQVVLQQSNLVKDLTLLEKGDSTMIGEKGVTLSGGQKARLSLARALYTNADLILLDDPISAVDARVQREIFSSLKLISKDKIILLVTHQVQFAPECDEILILQDGVIQAAGPYQQVSEYFKFIGGLEHKHEAQEEQNYTNAVTKQDNNELYKKEESTSKPVTFETYIRFLRQWGCPWLLICIMLFNVFQELLLQYYFRVVSQFHSFDNFYFLIGMLCIGALGTNIIKYLLSTIGVLAGNRKSHNEMVDSLGKAPISYFDTNPSGRILNRFSNDKSMMDFALNLALWEVYELNAYFYVSIAFLISILPYFAIIMGSILMFQIWYMRRSMQIIIQSKECDSIQKSPLFDYFKNTLNGIVQIKLYKQENYFKNQFNALSNNCIRSNFTFYQCSTNFGYKVHLTGWLASVIGTMILIKIFDSASQFSQGLLILTIFNDQFQWCMRQMIQVHAMMSSNQRIFELIDIKQEAPHITNSDPKDWPSKGLIQFQNVHSRYRQETPLVLKGLTFEVSAGQRVGIIGRTGAGKSSILQVLFRMNEIEKGSILIDGLDISTIGLKLLRSSIGIIPQSPFLFSGNIRRNIDPLNHYQDSEIWNALKMTQLHDYIYNLPMKLDTDMSQVNQVFSVGQKQLICLVRVILSNKKIIVLDEATANLDNSTDSLIQTEIKRLNSKGISVITIAHRLNTIADYDQIIILSDGKVVEIGKPLSLLCENPSDDGITKKSYFSDMVQQTGPQNTKLILELAKS